MQQRLHTSLSLINGQWTGGKVQVCSGSIQWSAMPGWIHAAYHATQRLTGSSKDLQQSKSTLSDWARVSCAGRVYPCRSDTRYPRHGINGTKVPNKWQSGWVTEQNAPVCRVLPWEHQPCRHSWSLAIIAMTAAATVTMSGSNSCKNHNNSNWWIQRFEQRNWEDEDKRATRKRVYRTAEAREKLSSLSSENEMHYASKWRNPRMRTKVKTKALRSLMWLDR